MAQTATNGEALFKQLRGLLDCADDVSLRQFFADLHAADIADCLEQVSEEERSRIFFLLPPPNHGGGHCPSGGGGSFGCSG